MTHGYLEGRDPNGAFSVSEYIAANPDIPLTINHSCTSSCMVPLKVVRFAAEAAFW